MQKISWNPLVTVIAVLSDDFSMISGENSLMRHPEDESKTGQIICNKYGSKLYTDTAKGQPISVHTSTLENEAEVEVMVHTNVESKSPTFTITDSLPQFNGHITKDDYMKLVNS